MSLWDALRMNMMISYQELVRAFPKGVMIEHRSLLNLLLWHNQRFAMDEHSRSTLIAGVGFDVAQWKSGRR